VGTTSAGTLSGGAAIVPKKPLVHQTVNFTLAAENPGDHAIAFTAGSAAGLRMPIQVLNCAFKILYQAHDVSRSDLVDFEVDIVGHGDLILDRFRGDWIAYEEKAEYQVFIKPNYAFERPEVRCKVEKMLEGKSKFIVEGKVVGNLLDLGVSFDELQLTGEPELKCEDIADSRGAVEFLKSLTADPDKYIPLRDVKINVKGGIYRFIFGEHGTGFFKLTPFKVIK